LKIPIFGVSVKTHYASATIPGGGRKLPLPFRIFDLIPDWLKGADALGGVGSVIAGCECDE
jgi:hypothetical protein